MKSSGTSYDTLFDAYENMRTLSEIESEIAEITPTAVWKRSLSTSSKYFEGYLDALRWVIGEERKGTNE